MPRATSTERPTAAAVYPAPARLQARRLEQLLSDDPPHFDSTDGADLSFRAHYRRLRQPLRNDASGRRAPAPTAASSSSTPRTTTRWRPFTTFTGGSDGAIPYARSIADALGNLYGTTFQLGRRFPRTAPSSSSTPRTATRSTTLHNFDSEFGTERSPQAALIADASGNLFGTTRQGGAGGTGVVFSLTTGAAGARDRHRADLRALGGRNGRHRHGKRLLGNRRCFGSAALWPRA